MPITSLSRDLVREIKEGYPDIRTLNLARNEISEISSLEILAEHLVSLDLSWNRIQDVGFGLLCLVNLKCLVLSHNEIASLSHTNFTSLKQLIRLDLSNNQLTDRVSTVTAFETLDSLVDLNLSEQDSEVETSEWQDYVFEKLPQLAVYNFIVRGTAALPPALVQQYQTRPVVVPALTAQQNANPTGLPKDSSTSLLNSVRIYSNALTTGSKSQHTSGACDSTTSGNATTASEDEHYTTGFDNNITRTTGSTAATTTKGNVYPADTANKKSSSSTSWMGLCPSPVIEDSEEERASDPRSKWETFGGGSSSATVSHTTSGIQPPRRHEASRGGGTTFHKTRFEVAEHHPDVATSRAAAPSTSTTRRPHRFFSADHFEDRVVLPHQEQPRPAPHAAASSIVQQDEGRLQQLYEQIRQHEHSQSVVSKPAANEVPFEQVLDVHRWAMQYLDSLDAQVARGTTKEEVWREAVWTLAVEKKCLELETSRQISAALSPSRVDDHREQIGGSSSSTDRGSRPRESSRRHSRIRDEEDDDAPTAGESALLAKKRERSRSASKIKRPQEVGAAAAAVLGNGESRVLGAPHGALVQLRTSSAGRRTEDEHEEKFLFDESDLAAYCQDKLQGKIDAISSAFKVGEKKILEAFSAHDSSVASRLSAQDARLRGLETLLTVAGAKYSQALQVARASDMNKDENQNRCRSTSTPAASTSATSVLAPAPPTTSSSAAQTIGLLSIAEHQNMASKITELHATINRLREDKSDLIQRLAAAEVVPDTEAQVARQTKALTERVADAVEATEKWKRKFQAAQEQLRRYERLVCDLEEQKSNAASSLSGTPASKVAVSGTPAPKAAPTKAVVVAKASATAHEHDIRGGVEEDIDMEADSKPNSSSQLSKIGAIGPPAAATASRSKSTAATDLMSTFRALQKLERHERIRRDLLDDDAD
ncbi:unnamed protein product [Amoebophrya sp. A25]|nr:unnamed protein product [Amoebophrya sp. A25]|eukprot:GSA25T00006458001.1